MSARREEQPRQRGVHQLLAGTDCHGRDLVVRAVAPLGRGLDGGEVLVVAVAVAEEEELTNSRAFAKSIRMLAKEFTRRADERDLAVENCDGESRADAVGVFINEIHH